MIGTRSRLAMVALALLPSACSDSGTEPCRDAGALAGRWEYSAYQSSPVALEREGYLEIEPDACPDLRGRLDVIETGPSGDRMRIAGPIYGTSEGDEVLLNWIVGATVEHSAVLIGDSIRGDWIEVQGGQITSTGTFSAGRQVGP